MTLNLETYYGNFVVGMTKNCHCYRVDELWDDVRLYVEAEIASTIAEKANEDPYLVAIILATIKRIRLSGTEAKMGEHRISREKPTDDSLIYSIVTVLSQYSATETIDIFNRFKWHELKMIINSDEPLKELA